MKTGAWTTALAAVLSLTLAAACGGDPEPGRAPEPPDAVSVSVSQAAEATAPRSVPATLVASREARIATRMAGTVREVPVDVGSRVQTGQPLVILDDSDVRARIEAARARAELASRTHGRVRRLAADGAASRQELDEAEAALEAAESAVRDAEAQAGYAVVRAPFSGVVTARSVDPGALATPGTPLLTLQGEGALEVEAHLPTDRIGSLRPGDRVSVVVPVTGTVHDAEVTRVSPAAERGSRRFRVEARLLSDVPPGGAAVPGAFVRLQWNGPGEGTRWIPVDAVVRRGQLTGVYAVEEGVLRLRWLRLGERQGDAVEVLAGPWGSDLVVARAPDPSWIDGTPVEGVTPVPWSGPAAADPAGEAAAEGVAP